MMDWTKPGKAIIVTACAIIFTFFVHFCCYLLYRGRVWLFTKLCIRGRHNRDGEMGEGLNDDSGSRMGGGNAGGGGSGGAGGAGGGGIGAGGAAAMVGGGGSSQDYAHQQQYPIAHTEQPRVISQQPPASYQLPPQYSGYLQQPVVAGVNVGVVSADGVYQPIGTESGRTSGGGGGGGVGGTGGGAAGDVGAGGKHKSTGSGSGSALTRTVAHLDAAQREQFLNPNKIVEYKM